MARVRLTPIDGIGRVGGSVWLVQQGRDALIIDFGADLQRSGKMLGGRIHPRATRGLHDVIELGLLPTSLDVYREDLLLDRAALEDARNVGVTDLLLTHSHADHAGRIYALDPEIRIHATPITAAQLLADTIASSGLFSESTHFLARKPHPQEQGILVAPRGSKKLSRNVLTLGDPPSENIRAIWREQGSEEGLSRSDGVAGGMPISHMPVDHSVWGACAFILQTDQGPVVHAGDLRWHGQESHLTERFVRKLKETKPRVLILEATRIGRDNEYVTEIQVRSAIVSATQSAGKRLIIGMVSGKNYERLGAFLHASHRSGRSLVVQPRTFLALESIAAADPYYNLLKHGVCLYDPPSSTRSKWHRELRERWTTSLITPDDICRKPGRFIYMSSSGQQMSWADLKPYNARLIYSSSAAYDAEAFDKVRILRNWIEHYNLETVGLTFSGSKVTFLPALNASGHLHPDDLQRLLHRVRPEVLIPCHTDRPELLRDLVPDGVKLVLPSNDRTIRL